MVSYAVQRAFLAFVILLFHLLRSLKVFVE